MNDHIFFRASSVKPTKPTSYQKHKITSIQDLVKAREKLTKFSLPYRPLVIGPRNVFAT